MASELNTILTGTLSVLNGLTGLSGYDSGIRDRPFCSVEHGDTLPFVCVSAGKERELELYRGGALVEYPVYVALFYERGPAVEDAAARQAKFERRAEVRHALWQPQAVKATQIDADYDPDPPWDLAGLDALFDVSLQLFRFTNDETR